VRQLGSDSYIEREQASERLEAIGEPALALLRRALTDEDPELRRRAQALVYFLELQWWMFGHSQDVITLAVSPRGDRVLSGSKDGTVRLWDLQTCKELVQMEGHAGPAWGVAFAPDGKQALAAGQTGCLALYDATTGKKLREMPRHPQPVRAVAFTPDGRRALSGCYDHLLRLWDLDTGTELRSFKGHIAGIMAVACSPDGKRAVTGGGQLDSSVRIWDLETGKVLRVLRGHTERVMGVAFTPDGKKVVSSAWDSTVRIWDATLGKELLLCRPTVADETGSAPPPIPGGGLKMLAGPRPDIDDGHFWGVAVAPDGRWLAAGTSAGNIYVFDAATGKRACTFSAHRGAVSQVVFAPDGRLVSASADSTLHVWHLPQE
jgi:WD40 repeat protein